ncbi:YcfL family protein [Photobacterium sp. Alg240-V54]|uniref:YcfL family protein n=1 Tax=Photobacterium sp. Alg240-V54 TaxID=2305995 RepID=UPI0013D72149|nr:YcfL family protein [Photobacterium sp. Alg240-V54]
MKYRYALSILLAVLVTGCSGITIPGISLEQGNHHVVIGNTILANKLDFSRSQTELQGGYLHASVDVTNKTDAAISLSYRFYWYDGSGLEICHSIPTLQTLIIKPNQRLSLQALAPTTAATQYRIVVRDTQN